MKVLETTAVALACLSGQVLGRAVSHRGGALNVFENSGVEQRALLQDVVTWDNQSLYIHGERLMIFSGEVHPFRLPVSSLYIDIFQKIKALGFNTVSFYVDWALLEGKPGSYRADGIFDLQPFFDAAKQAGIYLLARPGPYINAEVSGGGFPGWLQRVNGTLRTRDPGYWDATENYANHIGATIAANQITKGGPIILYQPENEYSGFATGYSDDAQYMQDIMDTARNAGVIIPFISNDAWAGGHNAPGSGVGAVDIYGHDSYPLGFDCANPSTWPSGGLPTYFREDHVEQSPSTPFSLVEFQGGAFDPWQGSGFENCVALLGPEFERVFYKNNIAAGVAFLNLYMTFGGTNWGNLGYPDGYTSYDYGAAISESRSITREKYSQLKLLGNFLKASPSYLDVVPGSASNGTYTSTTALTVTPLIGRSTKSSFYVVRHADYTSLDSTGYTLKVPTSAGTLTLPQLGGSLTLNGRDSKIHVTDYDVAGTNILYSTAEVFTWKNFSDYKALVLYGGAGEHHELAISSSSSAKISIVDGSKSGVTTKTQNGQAIIAWDVSSSRRIVKVDDLLVFLLDRNSAYDYWVPQVGTSNSSIGFTTQETVASSIIVNAGYLVRYAWLQGSELHLSADFNATTTVEVIGVPKAATSLYVNGVLYSHTKTSNGFWTASVKYSAPKISLPDFSKLTWKYVDSLPEIQSTYDDSAWVSADHDWTNNTANPLKTPVSLYASDYGFNTGHLLYRGHFVANGNEKTFYVETIGGSGFGSSVWLNGTLLGSWAGNANNDSAASTYTLPTLKSGSSYTLTILTSNTGLEEDWTVGTETMKTPRGILDFDLSGHSQSDVTWKITGNLGGEDYVDLARGPLNEGGLYAERQGWHQPSPPSSDWKTSSPFEGISQAGVGFYSTSFTLDLPQGYDIPLSFTFGDSSGSSYRVQLYVNGYQYGTYVPQLGPQTQFPVPQGILNYQGENWVAITLWAQESSGAKVDRFELTYTTPVLTALTGIESSPQPAYSQRAGAY
ncbi:Glycoside hydrolase, family 35 [Penicillium occitanis (nom. inval.)]|nr:hypothetical protein PENOC_035820 [Penicillium occitanis (nom. inval.)]PCH05034.1 Glycoside hydrolase, family 35 [Penicillium occitanis (nom. inval.)]